MDANNAMFQAITTGQLDEISSLVNNGVANVNGKNQKGEPYILFATKCGNFEVVKCLKELGADINARGDDNISPLDAAAISGKPEDIKILKELGADTEAKNNNDQTPLFVAVLNGKAESVKMLKELGANVNPKDNSGGTPMFLLSTIPNNAEMIKFYATLGGDVNAMLPNDATPMFFAAATGQIANMECLKNLGARLDVKNNGGQTAMDFAESIGQSEAAQWLRANVVEPDNTFDREKYCEMFPDTEDEETIASDIKEEVNVAPTPTVSATPVSASNFEKKIAKRMSPWQGYISFWKNYASFNGRARRTEFWGATLFNGLIGGFGIPIFESIVFGLNFGNHTPLYWGYLLATIVPSFSISWRRLHDTGRSGANSLWGFTIIGMIPLLIWCCQDSAPEKNQFGTNPKEA
jgi:ankyrin repeat protein/uncharacterized membrane protein YhaH (DUF805 family)